MAKGYQKWQKNVLKKLLPLYDAETNTLPTTTKIMDFVRKETDLSKYLEDIESFVGCIKVSTSISARYSVYYIQFYI